MAELMRRRDRLGAPQDGPVFSIKDPSGWFDAALERAGIEGVTWHTLRHTFASRLVMRGVNLTAVQLLMGHKCLAMTACHAHLAAHHLRAALQLIIPLWGKQVQNGQYLATWHFQTGGARFFCSRKFLHSNGLHKRGRVAQLDRAPAF